MKPQGTLRSPTELPTELPPELMADAVANPAPDPAEANGTGEQELREALLFIEAEENSDDVGYRHWGLNE